MVDNWIGLAIAKLERAKKLLLLLLDELESFEQRQGDSNDISEFRAEGIIQLGFAMDSEDPGIGDLLARIGEFALFMKSLHDSVIGDSDMSQIRPDFPYDLHLLCEAADLRDTEIVPMFPRKVRDIELAAKTTVRHPDPVDGRWQHAYEAFIEIEETRGPLRPLLQDIYDNVEKIVLTRIQHATNQPE